MKVFKESITIGRKRADGSPGFLRLDKGRTPESYGLSDEEIASIEHQLVEREGVTETVTMTPDKVLDEATLEQRIVFAIASMLKDDPKQKDKKLWTKEKLPRVEIIERMIDESITEAQRDEAWANYEKEV